MDSKLFARIGAGAFVAIAITMAVFELREEPAPPPSAAIAAANEAGDHAKATLAYCAALGLEAKAGKALEHDACQAVPVADDVGEDADKERLLNEAGKYVVLLAP